MNMDMNANTVAASKITFDVRLWLWLGDKRRNRNAMEHFVSHRVMI